MEKSKAAPKSGVIGKDSSQTRSNGSILVIAALDMSWRLAIVVLAPIIGGFELDKHLGVTPALTMVGFLLAMAGLFFILKGAMARADEKFKARTPK